MLLGARSLRYTMGQIEVDAGRCHGGLPASGTLVLLAALLLPGCAPLRLPPRTLVGDEGAAGVLIRRIGFHHTLQTFSILPGPESTEVPTFMAHCDTRGVHVQVWSAVHDAQQSSRVCHVAAQAAAASLEAAGIPGKRMDYRVTLVSDGGGTWRHPGRRRGDTPSLAFWFPVQRVPSDRELARIVRTTAHEFHHVGWALNGSPRRVWADEPAAYATGSCTQLVVLGRLHRQWLPRAHDRQDDAVHDQAVTRSSRAGADLHARLLPFFEGNEEIHRESTAVRAVMAWCQAVRSAR